MTIQHEMRITMVFTRLKGDRLVVLLNQHL